MPDFQPLRRGSRIFELRRSAWIDLPFDLDEDPDTVQPMLSVLQSLGGQVQTQPGVMSSRLRLVMAAMDSATRRRWKLFFDRTLATGGLVEFVRDLGRYFWLPGDSSRDIEAGQPPAGGSRYSLVTPESGLSAGAISVDLANPAGCSRTNLVPNGDFLDDATASGWVVDTPTTLGMVQQRYLLPNGQFGMVAEFHYKAAGTKTAHLDFDLGGLAVNFTPDEALYMTMLWRSDRAPGAVLNVVSGRIVMSDASFEDVGLSTTAPIGWERFGQVIPLSAIVVGDTTVRLQLTFLDALKLAPTYITELQIEARDFSSAFIPYSTIRESLTGSRASADVLSYLNGLAYLNQFPAWRDGAQFGFTVGFTFLPHWNSVTIPTAEVWLYADGDTGDVDTVAALRIKASLDTLTATVTLNDGTTASVTKNFGVTMPQGRFIVSVLDGDGAAGSGHIALYVDGVLAASTTFAKLSARQGKFFWLGSKPDGTATAAGEFSDVVLAPVYIDGADVTIDEFEAGQRPDRNSWRCVMDSSQKGRSDRVQDNQVPLDIALIESVRTT